MLSNNEIINLIQNGAVGVLATDTVYGLVCNASIPAAVERLYAIKNREFKPGTVIAASIDQLVELGIPRRYLKPVEHFWPNPISVVVPVGLLHPEIHLGKGSIAVRIPNDTVLTDLLLQTGPLLTTSANKPGEPVAASINEARAYFGDTVDFYQDSGTITDHKPSTILRVVDDAIEVLREGDIHINEVGEITNEL